jgi:hypothetical protein
MECKCYSCHSRSRGAALRAQGLGWYCSWNFSTTFTEFTDRDQGHRGLLPQSVRRAAGRRHAKGGGNSLFESMSSYLVYLSLSHSLATCGEPTGVRRGWRRCLSHLLAGLSPARALSLCLGTCGEPTGVRRDWRR